MRGIGEECSRSIINRLPVREWNVLRGTEQHGDERKEGKNLDKGRDAEPARALSQNIGTDMKYILPLEVSCPLSQECSHNLVLEAASERDAEELCLVEKHCR